MSLPQAQRDISEKPAAGAVTDPVNKEQMQADVDRKVCATRANLNFAVHPILTLPLFEQLRFYGVIQALREGKYPDNQQIDETLRYVRDNAPMDVGQLSQDGQRLVQDVRDVIETARQIVQEKNADELFQNFLWHTRGVDLARAKQDPNAVAPIDAEKAKNDGQQAVTHLRTLLTLVLTNAEARKLLADFAVIGRDLFATGAVKAAELARPDEERLNRVDEAAPQDQFHTADGRTTTAQEGETPVLEANIAGRTIRQHPHNEFGTGAEIHGPGPDNREFRTGAEAKEHATDTAQSALDAATQRGQQEAQQIQSEADRREDPNEKKDVAKSGFRERIGNFKDGLVNRVPQEHKDKANDHYERTKNFLSEEYFPEERRDQFIFRAKKVTSPSHPFHFTFTNIFRSGDR